MDPTKVCGVLGTAVVVVIAVLIFLPRQHEIASYSDLEIADFKWESCYTDFDRTGSSCNHPPIQCHYPLGYPHPQLIGVGKLVVYSSQSQAYAKIYADGRAASSSWYTDLSVLKEGANSRPIYFNVTSLNTDVALEVCVSRDRDFTRDSPDVLCKQKSFHTPHVAVEISPDALTFTIERDKYFHDYPYAIPKKTIMITNVGDVPVEMRLFFPISSSYQAPNMTYPAYYPQYSGYPSADRNGSFPVLQPGQSVAYDVTSSISDTPLGEYTSTAYVYYPCGNIYESYYKKGFTLVTKVM